MKETPRYFDHHDIVAHRGINEIDGRKYYCYIDTNNTVCVIPSWYRWGSTVLQILMLSTGVMLGWWFG
jgi:hypothetical protein